MADDPATEASGLDSAAPYRRAGLTDAEARRLARTAALRDETPSPWESSFAGIVLWVIWRGLYKGFQPAWFLASLGVAAWFGLQILQQSGGLSGVSAAEPSVDERLGALVIAAVPSDIDAHDFWSARMEEALNGDRRRRADIETFRTWAALGPDLIGRDRLALEHIAGERSIDEVEAELRAGAPWVREERLGEAFAGRIREGEHRGLDPAALIFADPALIARYEASLFRWSVAEAGAREFFSDASAGQFEMTSLPGLVSSRAGDRTRLYGGVRVLVTQACSYSREERRALAGCSDAIIPQDRLDETAFALAALESGLVELDASSSLVEGGAQVLGAARQAGRLNPGFSEHLDTLLAAALPIPDLQNSMRSSDIRADLAFAAPARAERTLAGRMRPQSSDSVRELTGLLESIGRLRRSTSPTVAIRLMSGVDATLDAAMLARLSGTAQERLLAIQLLVGEDMFAVLDDLPPPPEPEPRLFHGLWAGLVSALMVLLLSISRLMTAPLVRQSSRLNAVDARLCRLFLGSKD